MAGIPAPLGIGKVRLADGNEVPGFVCEPAAIEGAEEITRFGGWLRYLETCRDEGCGKWPVQLVVSP